MKRKIIYGILYLIIAGLFIYVGTYNYKIKTKEDNVKVANKFKSVDKNNKYKVVELSDVLKTLKNSGVILLANSNDWSDKYAYIVNQAALNTDIKEIELYDITVDRSQNNKLYKELINKLNHYVIVDDENNKHLYMPALIVVKDSEIIYFDNETAEQYTYMKVDEYWSKDSMERKQSVFETKINEYLGVEIADE